MADKTGIEWADATANLWTGCTKVSEASDFFDNHKSILPTWRQDFFDAAEADDCVILMLVTKRPENVRKMVPAHWLEPGGWPAHVWLITTAEHQKAWYHRIPRLLDIADIPVMGVSVEPLLGPLYMRDITNGHYFQDPLTGRRWHDAPDGVHTVSDFGGRKLSLVIVGGESGKHARDNDFLANADGVLRQCLDADVAYFGKQGFKKRQLPAPLNLRQFPDS